MALSARIKARMDALKLVPRKDALKAFGANLARQGRCDEALVPLWAEALRHLYPKLLETKYPELPVANGEVLPIDRSIPPSMEQWVQHRIDHVGFASWIDDDGHLAPNGASKITRQTGEMAEMGHKWDVRIFDLERAAEAGMDLEATKGRNAKRVVDVKVQWHWLFGDPEKDIQGLCTHPNITRTMAPLNAGATSRLPENKTNDEIAADFALLINTVPRQTIRAEHVATVYVSLGLMQLMQDRRLGEGDGYASLWDWIVNRYKGDETGQGKVSFRILDECEAANRKHPEYKTDTSGIEGDFMIAIPANDVEQDAFIMSRPFTNRPPQERDFVVTHLVHAKIGGFRTSRPLAFHMVYFGTT